MPSPRIVSLPAFIELGPNLWNNIPEILNTYQALEPPVLVVSGSGVTAELAQRLVQRFQSQGVPVEHLRVEKSDVRAVETVRHRVRDVTARLLLAVGGGKAIDVAKYTAYLENVPFVSIPTVLSSDGIASPVAVIQGIAKTHSVGAVMPIGVIVDLQVVRHAPLRYLRAGVGDLIANLSAVQDWRIAHIQQKDTLDELAATLAETGALAFLQGAGPHLTERGTLRLLAQGLILGGVAMGLVGSSRPCSGSEHLISHALDHLGLGSKLHGEQVALGTLIALTFQDHPVLPQVRTLFQTLGLPTTPQDLGLTLDDLQHALKTAPQMRPERYTILQTQPLDTWLAQLPRLFT